MKENKMDDMPALNLSSVFLLKSQAQNYHLTSLRKKMGELRGVGRSVKQLRLSYNKIGYSALKKVAPTTFLRLIQYWAICIGNIVNKLKNVNQIHSNT